MAIHRLGVKLLLCAVIVFLSLDILLRLHHSTVSLDPPREHSLVQEQSLVQHQSLEVGSQYLKTNPVSCQFNIPCEYPDQVDLRLVVITRDRWPSLSKLLDSLNGLHLDGDRASLEIWIDRTRDNRIDGDTISGALGFQWSRGPVRVHIQQHPAGLTGQWVNTYRPRLTKDGRPLSNEIGVILEDDTSVSPYAYRWLKAAHRNYTGWSHLAGVTLHSEKLIYASTSGPLKPEAVDGPSFIYRLLGTYGYSPNPLAWVKFQDWFHKTHNDTNFHPYVDGIKMTDWYKGQESAGHQDTMWEMWFIYFSHINNIYTIFNNLNAITGTDNACLIVHRRENGLHFSGAAVNNTNLLLTYWKPEFTAFLPRTRLHGWNFSIEQEPEKHL